MRIFGLALALLSWSLVGFAKDKATYTPIEITYSEEFLRGLDSEQRALLEQLAANAQKSISLVSDIQFNLPNSRFEKADVGQIISFADLLRRPDDSDELLKLAYNSDGTRRMITPEQWDGEIKTESLFRVPSVKYKGQNHVFQFSVFWHVGAKNIQIYATKNAASALRKVIVLLPMAITGAYDSKVSLASGLRHIGLSISSAISYIVGLSERVPQYSDSEVLALVEKARREYKLSGLKVNANEPILRKDLGFTPDLRLFNDELMDKATPVISKLNEDFNLRWPNSAYDDSIKNSSSREAILELRAGLEATYRKTARTPDELVAQVELAYAEARKAAYKIALLNDSNLEKFSPGLGQLLVNQARAYEIIATGEQSIQAEVEARKEIIQAQLVAQHRVKSQVPEWMAMQIATQSNVYYQQIMPARYVAIAGSLRMEKLDQEAFMFERNLAFVREQESVITAEEKAKTEAAREFVFPQRIYNPANWKIETEGEGENKRFVAQKNFERRVTTASPLWRVQAMFYGAASTASFSIYNLMYSFLWNGPVGWKALLKKDPFVNEPTVNSKTGAIEYIGSTSTLLSRWKDLGEAQQKERERFEASDDPGVFGKNFDRRLLRVSQFGRKYVIQNTVNGLQVVATIANSIASPTIALTSPLWAPMANLFLMGVNVFIYDFYSPSSNHSRKFFQRHRNNISPLLINSVILNLGVKGIAQGTIGFLAAPILTVASGAQYAWSSTRAALWTMNDAMFRFVFPLGRPGVSARGIPTMLTRVQGPGLSKDYYFQLDPQLVSVAVWARLEQIGFNKYKKAIGEQISSSADQLEEFKQIFGELIGLRDANGKPGAARQIQKATARNEEDMKKALAERESLYEKLLKVPDKANIRLTEADLAIALSTIQSLTQRYVESAEWTKTEREKFWSDRNLFEGDFEGLAKSLVAEVFSESILTPLEKIDSTFRLKVTQPSTMSLFDAVLSGTKAPTGDIIQRSRSMDILSCEVVFR